jgi:hypothetical protein
MANTDPNTKEKFDIWQEQGKEIVDIYKNDIDQLRQVLDAWVDLGFNKFNSFLAPQLDDFKQAILDTYDTYKDIADRTSQFAKTAHEAFENWNENGGGGSGGGSTPTPTDPNNPGGGGTSPGETSPGSTTPGGGETSPGGTTPGGETSPGGGGTSPGTTPNDPNDPDNPRPHAPPPPPPPRHDPLALDMNQDGEISTVSLADSTAFFDLTGDGIKEKVGWIQATDGLVAYDKNGNGKIDGINEVFGTPTVNGFEELRRIADSNYDGVIDRRDELYNQLKVWQDANQDGISQTNELKTLSEAGVKNIELNVFATNINLNGNLLSEAGRYTDSAGDRELAADIQLTFDARITTIDTSTIPNYTEHPESKTLPDLRGYGVVMDTSIAYNLNDTLRAMGVAYAADITKVATQFDVFMAEWSGNNFKRKVA